MNIQLTDQQFEQILADYHAKDEKRQRMTQAEILLLAKKLNEEINIPLVNEMKEEKILFKIILKVDKFLYDHLPNEIYDLIRSLDQGISDKEAEVIIRRLSKLANEKINIPYIPEALEYVIFKFVITLVVNAMRKKWNLEESCKKIKNAPDLALN